MGKSYVCGVVFLFFAGTVWAGQVGEWKKVCESEGITGWSRANSLSSVDEIRAEGIIHAPVPVIEAILRDTPAQKKYMFMGKDAFNVEPGGLKSTKDTYYTYFRQGMPWPLHDRYGVNLLEFMYDNNSGAVYAKAHGVATDFTPPDKNMIRVPVGFCMWALMPLNSNATKVTYQLLADPAGNLPSAVVNVLLKNLGVTTLKNIRKLAGKEPYALARTIVTITPYNEQKFVSFGVALDKSD